LWAQILDIHWWDLAFASSSFLAQCTVTRSVPFSRPSIGCSTISNSKNLIGQENIAKQKRREPRRSLPKLFGSSQMIDMKPLMMRRTTSRQWSRVELYLQLRALTEPRERKAAEKHDANAAQRLEPEVHLIGLHTTLIWRNWLYLCILNGDFYQQ
jgi:hypothetical protein